MSSNYPPPQQPAGQNPFAQTQYAPPQGQSPYGAPPAPGGFNGTGYPPPAFGGGTPTAPVAPAQDNVALGVLVGVVAAVGAALVYGLLIKGTKHEIGYAALGVGALVGVALGKVGGRNPALPVIGIPLALLGVYLGQLFGIALLVNSELHLGVVNIFTDHFHDLQQAWKDSMDAKDFLFFGIAGLEAFVIARRVAR
jgi:hypothetical protein